MYIAINNSDKSKKRNKNFNPLFSGCIIKFFKNPVYNNLIYHVLTKEALSTYSIRFITLYIYLICKSNRINLFFIQTRSK